MVDFLFLAAQSPTWSTETAWHHCGTVGAIYLAVSSAEEVVPEALRDGRADPENLGDALPPDHHVSVVQLDVHVRLFVQQVVGPTRWRQANQLPEVAVQLVASRCLVGGGKSSSPLD